MQFLKENAFSKSKIPYLKGGSAARKKNII